MTGDGVKIQAKAAEQCQYQQFDFLNQNLCTLEFNNATSDLVAQKHAKNIEANLLRCLGGTCNVERFPKLCTLLSSKIIVGRFWNKSTKSKLLRQLANENSYFSSYFSKVRRCAQSPLINSRPVNIALLAG
jgi:hypothetical protein